MKLFRFGDRGAERPGILWEGKRYDIRHLAEDVDTSFLLGGGIDRVREQFDPAAAQPIEDSVRLGAPVAQPGKILCIGLNYRKHAAESGMEPPSEPVVFMKATSAIIGPNDPVVLPKDSRKTDWEVELAVVIGKRASYVSKEEALSYVAGYTVHNDLSEREFQLERGGQWVKGKSCDTFAPLGPYLVTADEVGDPHNLRLWLKLNGERMQEGRTSDFIFDVPTVISYLSQFMSLMPGDVISTGTPEGVGLGLDPPRYLKPGDTLELGVEGLGIQKQRVEAWSR